MTETAETAARIASCETRILPEGLRDERKLERDREIEDGKLNVIGR